MAIKNLKYLYKIVGIIICVFSLSVPLRAQRLPHGSGSARQTSNRSVSSSARNTSANKQLSRKSATYSGRVNNSQASNKNMAAKPKNTAANRTPSHTSTTTPGRVNNRPTTTRRRPSTVSSRPTSHVHTPPRNTHYNSPSYVHHHSGPRPRPVAPPHPHPPYVWGSVHIHYNNPYTYFPFQPYRWGGWYTWGRAFTTIATTAIIVSVINDNNVKEEYNYDEGNFYVKTADGFVAVAPPIGAVVPTLPSDAELVTDGQNSYYYYGATFYAPSNNGFEVIIPTIGTIVSHLPDFAEEVKIGDRTYVKFDEMYFQPVKINNQFAYEIVEVN